MTTQTPITNIAPALARAQKKIAVADKNATRLTEGKQTTFADMESVVTACRDALAEQEISILQPLGGSATQLLVKTVLLHSSGEFLESEFSINPENPHDTDAVKSLVTQMRRYSLMGMLCIATADDDDAKKPAKPAEKKTVQEPGPVVETHEAEKPAEPEPVTTVETNDDEDLTIKESDEWKYVVCHYGSDDSPAKNRKLGELEQETLKFVQEKVLPALGKTKKDKALATAIQESMKEESTPAPAADTLPEPEKAAEPAKNAKETASSESPKAPEPMEWRSIAAHNFRPNPTITLGEIADSEPDALAKGYDGARILRGMKSVGIAKIQTKAQTTKDKILVNAILAANEEMDLRESLALRFADFGIDSNAHLVKSGVFEGEETLANCPRKILDYIVEKWSDIEATIKEAK